MAKIKLLLDLSKLKNEIEIEIDEEEDQVINKNYKGTPFHFTEYGWGIVDEAILNLIEIKSGEYIK